MMIAFGATRAISLATERTMPAVEERAKRQNAAPDGATLLGRTTVATTLATTARRSRA